MPTTYDRSASVGLGVETAITTLLDHIPGHLMLPPVVFYNATKGQRDILPQTPGMTVFNLDSSDLEMFLYSTWGKVPMYGAHPNAADALTYDPREGSDRRVCAAGRPEAV